MKLISLGKIDEKFFLYIYVYILPPYNIFKKKLINRSLKGNKSIIK